MIPRLRWVLLAAVVSLFGGCPKQEPPPPLDPTLAHVGVWHGTGLAFPNGELCLVFCPNAKLFAADTSCDNLAHPDFARSWTWARLSDGLLLAQTPDGAFPMHFRPQSQAEALFDLVGHAGLPMTRIALLSPSCLQP